MCTHVGNLSKEKLSKCCAWEQSVSGTHQISPSSFWKREGKTVEGLKPPQCKAATSRRESAALLLCGAGQLFRHQGGVQDALSFLLR